MLEGVKILYEQMSYTINLKPIFAAIVIFVMILCIGAFLARCFDSDWLFSLAIVIGIIAAISLGIYLGSIYNIYESGIEYKVTIDENVSMQEFNKLYEIIKQEGEIFTIRKR